MFESLKTYCGEFVKLDETEIQLIDNYFEVVTVNKKDFLLSEGMTCNFIGFIAEGAIRHFHIKDGVEKTCDISFENTWVTDFRSFTENSYSVMNLQAMRNSLLYIIKKEKLYQLYAECSQYETFGRIMAERVAQRATEIAMSLSSDKPEERFQKLIKSRPDLVRNIPQRYIADFLGISPESLSRIRSRILRKSKS